MHGAMRYPVWDDVFAHVSRAFPAHVLEGFSVRRVQSRSFLPQPSHGGAPAA